MLGSSPLLSHVCQKKKTFASVCDISNVVIHDSKNLSHTTF